MPQRIPLTAEQIDQIKQERLEAADQWMEDNAHLLKRDTAAEKEAAKNYVSLRPQWGAKRVYSGDLNGSDSCGHPQASPGHA